MPSSSKLRRVRESARLFEKQLPVEQRKRLGQFFTGMRLGKLLAHLALTAETRNVIDPMAGHGDLLDAASEAAAESGIPLRFLAGIEIDQDAARFCQARLTSVSAIPSRIVRGNAFDPATLRTLAERSFDLAITNPPYVRYQAQNGGAGQGDPVRFALLAIVNEWVQAPEQDIWRELVRGYSGLADLSVPAWILSALAVRPNGRLALVVPATWRSREYGDIIRYLLLRCFALEFIVEDTQPGWFSDALVRTHLIVARRLSPEEAVCTGARRSALGAALWIKIAPEAANVRSLVGAAFGGDCPEAEFSLWLGNRASGARAGIEARSFNLSEEWTSVKTRAARRSWYHALEADNAGLPLFADGSVSAVALPEALRDIAGELPLSTLEEEGVRTGQGLRTGCNRFFYVDAIATLGRDEIRIRVSTTFGRQEFTVPKSALRPVLRRQSETSLVERGIIPNGLALDLKNWILPEDAATVEQARTTYQTLGQQVPAVMPNELAAFVQLAAQRPIQDEKGQRVPELSAVRTNIRVHRHGVATPRFWYMLPEFMPRHLPDAFVARVNHGTPWVECNLDPSILIDANFSTFWFTRSRWTRFSLKAFLNSLWGQLLMESLGTPMGGGALKLEAVHLRQLPIPRLSNAECTALDTLGRSLTRGAIEQLSQINDIVFGAVFGGQASRQAKLALMRERAETLRRGRMRAAA